MTNETLEKLVSSFLYYSHPHAGFAFQGGEPTLAGLPFYKTLMEFQGRYRRASHVISNSIQTNGVLLDEEWCRLFRDGNWLVGVSLDGPEAIHNAYRATRTGAGTWRSVMDGVQLLRKQKIEFNVLCVVSRANVEKARELYRFFRSSGIDNLQFIPLAEFDERGNPLPFTITAEQYGRFLCEIFDLWWPHRRTVRVRVFDNLAEALAGIQPGCCTLQQRCDSYVVVEYNGDVFPCDFVVESNWKLGNINTDSFSQIAHQQRRFDFAGKKSIAHTACQECEFETVCFRGCPHTRRVRHGDWENLDYFCGAYKSMFRKVVKPLEREVARLLRKPDPDNHRRV